MSFNIIGLCLILFFVPFSVSVIVCPTLTDYFTFWTNKRCYDNPDGDAKDPTIIIERHGFHSKTYNITTADGYIITVDRLHKKIEKKTPIIIGHGVILNAFAFINRGNKSLAFFLANHGYQVWIINWRGTKFSRRHTFLSSRSKEYWDTGVEEMAKFDLKSVMEIVFEESKSKAIYLGYSMGATVGLVANIKEQKTAEKTLKGMVHLAPVGRVDHTKSISRYFLPFWPLIRPLINRFGHGEIHLYKEGTNLCGPHPFQVILCELIDVPLFGNGFKYLDPLTYPVTSKQNRDSITIKTLDLYIQFFKRKSMVEFSYGKTRNLIEYNSTESPQYDLGKVTLPQSFLVGKRDLLATPKDAEILYANIPESSRCGYLLIEEYQHRDFISANNVESVLFGKVLESIERIDNGKCH